MISSATCLIAIRAKVMGWTQLVAGIFLAALVFPAQAALPGSLHFENLDIKIGGNSAVTSLIQDRQGFVWIGTHDGLFRYDGYNFIHYQNQPDDPGSLPDNYIYTLLEDNRGTIWIGTQKGLVRINLETDSFTRFTSAHATGPSLFIKQVISDGKGGLWLATRGGLQHFDPDSGRFLEYKHDPSRFDSIATDNVDALALDDKGGLWLATWPGGLDYLAPGAAAFVHYRVDSPTQPDPDINNIRALHFDSQQRLWIGCQAGIVVWQTGKDWSQRKRLTAPSGGGNPRVLNIFEDKHATIWVAGLGTGLLRWDNDKNQFVSYTHRAENPYSLPNNDSFSVLVGRSDILWVGTGSEGLSRANLGSQGFEHFIPRDLSPDSSNDSNTILSIAGDTDGRLWLGSPSGLALVDTATHQAIKKIHAAPKRPGALSNNLIYSLYKARDGPLWIGTSSGLNRLDRADGRFRVVRFKDPASDSINHIAPGRAGILWLGTGGGLIRYDPASGSTKKFSHDPADPHSRSVNSSFISIEDRAGRVWVGGGDSGGGLDVLDQATGRFRQYRHDPRNPASLSEDHVSCLFEDAQGALWVGTSKGVNRVVPRQDGSVEFHSYPGSALASERIASIQGDSAGQIWVSTLDGLFKLDPVTGKLTSYYFSSGGFNGFIQRSSFRGPKGGLFFGSNTGMLKVQPEAVSVNSFPPQATITDISVFNRSLREQPRPEGVELAGTVTQPKALTLFWRNNTFSLEFSALHYADPRRNRYAYRLDGFDKDWVQVDAGQRNATYTNLDPGRYVFHVKASNNTGVWDETTLPITITPPFWKTGWFYTLTVGLLLALILLVDRWRIRQLRRNEIRLENLVTERSAEATRLRDEALAANQAKSEFLANMSHEIRTPMNSILGMAHLALNTEISPKGRNYLEKVRLSGLHLLGIIEEILDFSKISAGKLEIEKIDFDLGDVLENVKILLDERVRDKGLAFVINIDPGLPPCLRGDPLRLGQALINYAGNAVKFTETGGIIVRARKMDENDNGVLVRFEVQDTGIGIDDAEKTKLFQPFQQADSSTTREYGGTGLGLAISKQLVELMEEGKVGVESLAGEGSTFWFSVRLGQGRLLQAVAPVSAADAPSGKPAILSGARILLADDHPLNQEVATGMLEHAGAVVSLARNGKEALDLLGQQRFDCVLLDVQMPVMDGYETARLIRANPAWAGMPVIAMTANASKQDRERCLAAGMDDFISKPFNPATFYATLAQWLAGPAQQTPFPATPATLPGTAKWGGDPDIIDLSVLAGWNGGNKLKMREFVLKFLALAKQDMAEIDTALDHGNLEALGTLGHHNRSPARMVGAMGFAKLCQALEELSESKGSMEQARDIVSQMHPLLDRISEQVNKELA